MTFEATGSLVWDFWVVRDPATGLHHLFHLHAPASLGDAELRHRNARIGHAVSPDLRAWERRPDPLPAGAAGFDDLASWTGCTLRGEDRWWMFSTGLSSEDDGLVQRVGAATSPDLDAQQPWTRTGLLLAADPEHYQLSCPAWPEEAWRDPWVVRARDRRWHMYVTARAASGAPGCGVIGHAVSHDLAAWDVVAPLSAPTGRFEWLEVIQVARVEGRWVLLFSCLSDQMVGARPGAGGVWSVPVEGPGCPVDVAPAVRVTDESRYAGKVVEHGGSTYFLAFRNRGKGRAFVGGLTDPEPVTWRADGRGLVLACGAPEP